MIIKTIKDFSRYKVDEHGNVYSYALNSNGRHKNGGVLATRDNGHGYLMVGMARDDGKRKFVSVHRVVAINFIPNHENKRCVNHLDGNKRNNHYTNLEWATDKENVQHSFANKLQVNPKGFEHNMIKLTRPKCEEVLRLRELGWPYRLLGEWMGVSKSCICHFLTGRNNLLEITKRGMK